MKYVTKVRKAPEAKEVIGLASLFATSTLTGNPKMEIGE
jgi:hypothetical protein